MERKSDNYYDSANLANTYNVPNIFETLHSGANFIATNEEVIVNPEGIEHPLVDNRSLKMAAWTVSGIKPLQGYFSEDSANLLMDK